MVGCRLTHMNDFFSFFVVVNCCELTRSCVPLPITHPILSEALHTDTVSEKTVAETEILYLYPMLTGCHVILVSAYKLVVHPD